MARVAAAVQERAEVEAVPVAVWEEGVVP